MGFSSGSEVKSLPAMQGAWVRPLDGEDPLETGMAAHSGILAWRIPWTEDPGGLQSPELGSWTQTHTQRACECLHFSDEDTVRGVRWPDHGVRWRDLGADEGE